MKVNQHDEPEPKRENTKKDNDSEPQTPTGGKNGKDAKTKRWQLTHQHHLTYAAIVTRRQSTDTTQPTPKD
eukprot:12904115-Prorocentrum_lima.AAC.1